MTADFDPLDMVDIDRMVRVNDERAIRQHEQDRLLSDGRHVTPDTVADQMAAIGVWRAAEAERYADLFATRCDWRHDGRRIT